MQPLLPIVFACALAGLAPGASAGPAPCPVLWFGADHGDLARLAGFGWSVTRSTSVADLAPANLARYGIVVVGYQGAGVLGSAQGALAGFVAAGGGLLVHQPNANGPLDYVPAGFEVRTLDLMPCHVGSVDHYDCVVVDPAHPITAGLADADLPGDYDVVGEIGPAWRVLTVNPTCRSTMALGVGAWGAGRIAYDSGCMTADAIVTGSPAYWQRLFGWLCPVAATPATPRTWGNLKSAYR